MLTTVTPAEQLFSIVSKALIPPNDAPYPTLVGQAITGQSTSPPTTLGNAPSMPAQTTTTSAAASLSRCLNSRCTPATPTSAIMSAFAPSTRAVTSASWATGRSLVPAVTTYTCPDFALGSVDAGSQNVRASRSCSACGNT